MSQAVIQSLYRFREEVYDNPDKDIDESVKKLRQVRVCSAGAFAYLFVCFERPAGTA